MYQVVYLSRATQILTSDDINQLLSSSLRANDNVGITGLLLFDGDRFIQALEGPEGAVMTVMERIKKDSRHCDISYMAATDIAERQFGAWSMHGRALLSVKEADMFCKEVRGLLHAVADPRILAAFIGFASMSRSKFRRHSMSREDSPGH